MATLTLSLDASKPLRTIRRLREKFPAANVRALNRAIVTSRTYIASNMARNTGLKSADVKKEIVTREARPDKGTASIEIRGTRIPLIKFNAKGPDPSRGLGKGVTARLPGGAGRYPHAFIATMASGHRGVFQRKPGGRRHGPTPMRSQLPIYELRGPSLPHVFAKYIPEGLRLGQEALIKNLRSELRFALQQAT